MREADHNMCRLGGGGKWIGHPSKSSECGEWTYQQPAIRLFSFGWATSTSKYCCCLLPAGVAGDVALLLAWLAGGGLLLPCWFASLLLVYWWFVAAAAAAAVHPSLLTNLSSAPSFSQVLVWSSRNISDPNLGLPRNPDWERTTEDRHVTGHTKRLCDMKLPV